MFELFLIAAGTLLASYLYTKLRYMRNRQYAHIPQLPNHLLWGHLKTFGDFMNAIQTKSSKEMWESMGRPPIMLVDLRPINPPMVLVPNHSIAEQISKPSKASPLSKPKSPTWTHMLPIIGTTSILGREGQDWKHLSKRFNPGFTAQHLWNLLPLILEKMEPFCNYLDQFTNSQDEFPLERIISNLTFDVIGVAVMEVQLDAQHLDRLKANFLFAWHDTNTSTLQWAFYELSRTPRALKAVREELDEILGPQTDTRTICAVLAQNGENLLPHMHYINAVIKETLRLHPPASTVGMTDPGTGFKVCAPSGEEYMLDGLIMYSYQSIIHRDSAVYGDTANDWVSERWLGDATKSIPVSA
ncbi:putative Cytochrome P450 [Seiridium cardinale]